MRPWNGSTDSITAGCSSQSGMCHSRVRRSVLSTTGGSGLRGLTQVRSSPRNPARFISAPCRRLVSAIGAIWQSRSWPGCLHSGGLPSCIDSTVPCSCSTPLGLFAVAGAQKALTFGLNPVAAALLGMLTGIGGGMTRDVLLAEIPTVLRADLYARRSSRCRGRSRRRGLAPSIGRRCCRRGASVLWASVHGHSSSLALADRCRVGARRESGRT